MAAFALVTFFIFGIVAMGFAEDTQQQQGTIRPLSVYSCEDFVPPYEYSFALRTIDEENNKMIDMEIEVLDEFNEDWTISIKLDKWTNGQWDENFVDITRAPACDLVRENCLELWLRILKTLSPPVSEECRADPGFYTLKDFEILKREFKVPVYIDGKYRATARVYNANGIEIICQTTELESEIED